MARGICFESEDAANRAKESLEGKNVCGYNLLCKIISDKGNQIEKQFQKKNGYFSAPFKGDLNLKTVVIPEGSTYI